MGTVGARLGTMERGMTAAQLEKELQGQWVVLCDPELDENGELVRGELVYHGSDRREAWCEAGKVLQNHKPFVFFVGQSPDTVDFVL